MTRDPAFSLTVHNTPSGTHMRGLDLEAAVASIEAHVLAGANIHDYACITTETRKTVIIDGVRHELDICTDITISAGYTLRTIFECKNWSRPVDKNAIIVFAEKIRATSAQTGYFVAPAFSRSARAQARLEPRLRLLEVDTSAQPWWGVDNITLQSHDNPRARSVSFRGVDGILYPAAGFDKKVRVDTVAARCVSLTRFLRKLSQGLSEQHAGELDTAALAVGKYVVQAPFAVFGHFRINAMEFDAIYLDLQYNLEIIRPRIEASYDVATRGRFCRSEPVFSHGKWKRLNWTLDAELVQLLSIEDLPESFQTSLIIEELPGDRRPSGSLVRTLQEALSVRMPDAA